MTDLKEFQQRVLAWQTYNFPNNGYIEPLMGIVEEVGELYHAVLKSRQQIRGFDTVLDTTSKNAAKDAVGDTLIYLFNFCSLYGLSIEECAETAWGEIKDRDWRKYPKTGRPPLV